MCSPEAWTGASLGMLKASAENAASMAQWSFKKQLEEMGEARALEAARTQYKQVATRQMQERMSRGQEIAMIVKKVSATKAAATARAAKAGVSGKSVQAQQQQFEREALQSIGIRKQEAEWADAMIAQQKEAIEQQAQARIEAVQAGPRPSSSGRFMNIVSAMASGAVQASQFKTGIEPTTPTPPSPITPVTEAALPTPPPVFGELTTQYGYSTLFEAEWAGALRPYVPVAPMGFLEGRNPLLIGGNF